jgi:hypothetical protein
MRRYLGIRRKQTHWEGGVGGRVPGPDQNVKQGGGGGGGGGGLFVFNDTIDGPRAPAVKPGRITQA